MKVTNIKESGSNNVLLWAIKSGADVYNDLQLKSVVNDELFYQITLEDINFLELMRLSQIYREKLRIIKQKQAEIPSNTELTELFKGSITIGEGEEASTISRANAVEYSCSTFLNLVRQMENDSDIISPSSLRMFLPMLTRKIDVQIPVGFYDFMSFLTEDEANDIFNIDYPTSLNKIFETENHGFHNKFALTFIKATTVIKYPERYDKYIDIIKYRPLVAESNKTDRLYTIGLLGFHKYDNVSRGEIRCSLFEINKESLSATFRRIKGLQTPLHVDFAVELPIQYMQMLLNAFGPELLTISYESSMATIINGGLDFNDFIMPEQNTEKEPDAEEIQLIKNAETNIDAYKVRISEANQIMLNTLFGIMRDPDADIDETAAFAILPSIYKCKAVLTINLDYADKYTKIADPVLSEMFNAMLAVCRSVTADINEAN